MERIIMKKVFLILTLVFSMSFNIFAQSSDNFFNVYNDPFDRISDPDDIGLNLPYNALGSTVNEPAPVGCGLLILTVLGAGYAIRKRNK